MQISIAFLLDPDMGLALLECRQWLSSQLFQLPLAYKQFWMTMTLMLLLMMMIGGCGWKMDRNPWNEMQ